MMRRVALMGASGTGKTMLANYIAETFGLTYNPVGSRSVAKEMGFESPYDVDAAGRRAEFQQNLIVRKIDWEETHESFVTDRTTFDNLTYATLHDVNSIDALMIGRTVQGFGRYTHVIYCPFDVFCDPAGDPNRVQNRVYQMIYDNVLLSLVTRFGSRAGEFITLSRPSLKWRQAQIREYLSI